MGNKFIIVRTLFRILIISILLLTIECTFAQYFPPTPPEHIVLRKTPILVSFTTPQKVVTIDVAAIDPKQVIEKIILVFKEPVIYVSFTIYHLREKPPGVPDPQEVPLLYFTTEVYEDLLRNVEKVTILFGVERELIKGKNIDEKTITLNVFFENRWEKLPTKKVAEDENYIYFEAESRYLSHFVVTGVAVTPFPWWIIALIIGIVLVAIGIYYARKRGIMPRGISLWQRFMRSYLISL